MTIIVPPGGFAGFQQMTAASQRALFPSKSGTGQRRTSKRKRAKPARVAKRRATRKAARLVKGSAAAKRYMAKIRRMRK